MKQDDSVLGELGTPSLKVVPDSVVSVKAIYVQEVNRTVGEMSHCFIKRRSYETRESGVTFIVIGGKLGEYGIDVDASMVVTFPCIDGVALGRQLECFDYLAERKVGVSLVCSKLNEYRWIQHLHERECKWDVLLPVAHLAGPMWLKQARRIVQRIER